MTLCSADPHALLKYFYVAPTTLSSLGTPLNMRGLFARVAIPKKGAYIGFYTGRCGFDLADDAYVLGVEHFEEEMFAIDGLYGGNQLCCVNCYRTSNTLSTAQKPGNNLRMKQVGDAIAFVTTRPIAIDEELFIPYGKEFNYWSSPPV